MTVLAFPGPALDAPAADERIPSAPPRSSSEELARHFSQAAIGHLQAALALDAEGRRAELAEADFCIRNARLHAEGRYR